MKSRSKQSVAIGRAGGAMRLRLQTVGLGVLLLTLAASCSPRYSVHEVKAPAFLVEEDSWMAPDTSLYFAYDFWSDTGQPYISIFNPGTDTAYLDLGSSRIRNANEGRIDFLDLLAGFPNASWRDAAYAYPSIQITKDRAKPELILAPKSWTSFYGLAPCVYRKNQRLGGEESEALVLDYVYRKGETTHEARHDFEVRTTHRPRSRHFRRYEASLIRPDRYYIDRRPERRRQSISIALEVATNVLFLL